MPLAGLGKYADADIGPAAAHREHPAVSRVEVVVEPDRRLAPVHGHALHIGALRDADVAAVGALQAEAARDDRLAAVGADHQPRGEGEVVSALAHAHFHETVLAADTGDRAGLADVGAGGLGAFQQAGVELVSRHDVAV